MTDLKKTRRKTVMRYTWPIYVVSAVIVALLLNFIFGITHRLPEYKTLTIFVSGSVTDSKKLEDDLLKKYEDKELKSVTTISEQVTSPYYATKLSVSGYNDADILIIPVSKLETLTVSAFGLDLKEDLLTSYYQNKTIYQQDGVGYGIKINKEAVQEYMSLPEDDCYMILNGHSENIGQYSKTPNIDHVNALLVTKDWGI